MGNITEAALVNSLSALELGKQYVAITQKACDSVTIDHAFTNLSKPFSCEYRPTDIALFCWQVDCTFG